jgi:hypothetical protein
LATPDGKAGGVVDAIIRSEVGVTIRDYKSGTIHELGDGAPVKEAYAIQVKLYAAIYEAMTGEWPSQLEIVPLLGEPRPIEFLEEECRELLADGLATIDEVTAAIEHASTPEEAVRALGQPSPEACRRCRYRPVCLPYREAGGTRNDDWPLDAWGRLLEVQHLGNGRLVAILAGEEGPLRIRGVDPSPSRHPGLSSARKGDLVMTFNLRATSSKTSYLEGMTTTFYKDDM